MSLGPKVGILCLVACYHLVFHSGPGSSNYGPRTRTHPPRHTPPTPPPMPFVSQICLVPTVLPLERCKLDYMS